jgi:hypothetical protein
LIPIWQSYIAEQHGRLLKHLQKLYEDKLNREVIEEIMAVAEARQWDHITRLLKRVVVTANPQTYRLF